ncbi:MAG: TonB-dependent siderophore receptor, partial [Candidatus Poribacteria bacterium]|nr:TonB-dependent siderophore receptor [Candidatus Poribacteria bacterium]
GVHAETGFGVHDIFYIRGFESLSNGLLLSDGAYEPEASFYHLYNVDRIEVLKGPGAFLYGGNPLAGTVNLVRKRPLDATFSSVKALYGQWNTTGASADLGWSAPDGNLSARLNGMYQASDFYRDHKDNATVAVNPTIRWTMDENATLDLSVEYVDASFKSDNGLPVIDIDSLRHQFGGLMPSISGVEFPDGGRVVTPGVDRSRSYQSGHDVSDQTILRGRLDYERRLSDAVTIRDKAYFTQFEWLSAGALFLGVSPNLSKGSLDLSRVLAELDDKQTVVGNQLEALLSVETGPVGHQVVFGLELMRFTDEFTLDLSALPLTDIYAQPTPPTKEPTIAFPSEAQEANAESLIVAPYVIDRIALSDRLQVFVGGRFDSIQYDEPLSATERSYSPISPMGGVVFSPTDAVSFYASGGRSFAPPSARIVGEVDAEESVQVEAGAKQSLLNGKLAVNVAVFQLDKDVKIPEGTTGVLSSLGTQRSRGVEVEVAAELIDGLRTSAAYAYTDAEFTELIQEMRVQSIEGESRVPLDYSGNTPAFAPKHLVNVWAEKRFGAFGIGGGGRYVSEQYVSEDNTYAIDGYMTFDATAFYELSGVTLRMKVENVTDREYETRGFGAASVIPADPVAVFGSIEWAL